MNWDWIRQQKKKCISVTYIYDPILSIMAVGEGVDEDVN